jgi:hypothetical protein
MVKHQFLLIFVIIILFQRNVKSQECGVSKIGRGNIFGGSFAIRGQFPW